MKGDTYIGRIRELMIGIDAKTFQNSLKLYSYGDVAIMLRQSLPEISEEEIEDTYARYLRGYLIVRELQIFGKTRGEIIGNLGNLVENNPLLREEYLNLITNLARNYDSMHERTLAEELGIKLEKPEVTLEQRVRQIDGRLLKLTLPKSVRSA